MQVELEMEKGMETGTKIEMVTGMTRMIQTEK